MQDKSNKTMEFKVGKADKIFTEERFTNYTGLTTDYTLIKRQFYGMHDILVNWSQIATLVVLLSFLWPNRTKKLNGWKRILPQ